MANRKNKPADLRQLSEAERIEWRLRYDKIGKNSIYW